MTERQALTRYELSSGTIAVERSPAGGFEVWHYRDGIEPELVAVEASLSAADGKARDGIGRVAMETIREAADRLLEAARDLGAAFGVDLEADLEADLEDEPERWAADHANGEHYELERGWDIGCPDCRTELGSALNRLLDLKAAPATAEDLIKLLRIEMTAVRAETGGSR
jgi:hypothetical protein